jgi:hypothetical protein
MEINTESDLLEVKFTHQELNRAAQMMDRQLSLAYLQQLRVNTFRLICALRFTPDELDNSVAEHRYLTGRLDVLDELIRGILNPPEVPINDDGSSQSPSL